VTRVQKTIEIIFADHVEECDLSHRQLCGLLLCLIGRAWTWRGFDFIARGEVNLTRLFSGDRAQLRHDRRGDRPVPCEDVEPSVILVSRTPKMVQRAADAELRLSREQRSPEVGAARLLGWNRINSTSREPGLTT
jgi:hypothetical protein